MTRLFSSYMSKIIIEKIDFTKNMDVKELPSLEKSGQIIIFHQPWFSWNKGKWFSDQLPETGLFHPWWGRYNLTSTPQKSNIETTNGHIWKDSPFARPIILAIQQLAFRDVSSCKHCKQSLTPPSQEKRLMAGTPKWSFGRRLCFFSKGWFSGSMLVFWQVAGWNIPMFNSGTSHLHSGSIFSASYVFLDPKSLLKYESCTSFLSRCLNSLEIGGNYTHGWLPLKWALHRLVKTRVLSRL